jgi:photosystem II stability/assembly factor-like uncharacterized protein
MPITSVRRSVLIALALALAASVALVAALDTSDSKTPTRAPHAALLRGQDALERAERLGIESPRETLAMNDAIASRYGEPAPGELQRGLAQKRRLSVKAHMASTPGAEGRWTPYGNTPLIDDDPTYPAANGDGFGKLGGRVSDFAYDPDNKTVYATVAQGGVWKTTDLGGHWSPIGDSLPIGSTSGIAWTKAGGGTLIVSTGDHAFSNDYPGVGVYWTTDEGASWHRSDGVPSGLLSFRVAVDPTNASIVYVATGGGLFRSTDAGRSFTNVNLPTGDCAGKPIDAPDCFFANTVTDVAVQPADKFGNKGGAVIAAVGWRAGQQPNFDNKPESPNNGVYRSDTGEPGSFKMISGTGFPDPTIAGRTEFGVTHGDGQNSNYLYAVVQNTHLFAEQAGGENDIPLVGTPSVLEGIFVSPDFGKTWTEMESRNEFFNPANGSALSQLVAAGIGPGYQTTYNEWMQVDPTRQVGGVPTRVLLGMEEVWQTLSTQTPQDGHSQFQSFGMYTANGGTCLVEPEACGAVQANKQSFTTTHPDQHGAILIPDGKGGLTLMVGNDGGVYTQHVDSSSEFSQNNWGTGANEGFHTLLPYGAAMAKDGTVFAGLQDNGQLKITPDGKQFATYVGDGIYALVNPDNSKEAWGELPATPVYFTTDGGQTWTQSDPGLTDADFVAPFVMDPKNAKHLVVGGRQIKEDTVGTDVGDGCNPNAVPPTPCTEDNTTWHTVYDLGTHEHPGDSNATAATDGKDANNLASALAVNGSTVYAGVCGGCDPVKLNVPFHNSFATNSGGKWHFAAAKGLPNRLITSVAMDPSDTKTVYVTLGCCAERFFAPIGSQGEDASDTKGGNLYKSTDAGESFTDVSGALPNVQATTVVVRGNQLVVGTSIGGFISSDLDGHGFVTLGTGLPPTAIGQFSLKPGDPDTLVAATFGRGVYTYRFAGTGFDTTAPSSGGAKCSDNTPPVSSITSLKVKKGTLRIHGRSRDKGCGMKRVFIAVQRVKTVKHKKRCYYVSSKGRTSKHRASCNRPKYPLRAKGTTKWSLTVKHLKRGHYQVYFRATDKAGNNERRRHKGRRFTVR